MSDRKIKLARGRMCFDKPWISGAAHAMKLIPSKDAICNGHPTMGVDKHWRCYYHPEFVQSLEIDQLMGVLLHELSHLLRKHSARAQSYGITTLTHDRWNVAADCEINDNLQKDPDIRLPEGACYPSVFNLPDDLSAEQYFERLVKDPPDGEGDKGKAGEEQPDPNIIGGSGSDNIPRPWEQGQDAGPPPITPVEAQGIIKHTAEEVKKSRGKAPGYFERWADEVLTHKVPWFTLLRSCLRGACATTRGRTDYSYRYINRRQGAYGNIIMPAMIDKEPKVCAICDTSGSMSQKDIGEGFKHMRDILSTMGIKRMTVYCVDAAVHTVQSITDPRQVKITGGGGTDMGVGLGRAIEDHPDVVVVFTDGYTPWPAEAPPFKTIVVLTTSCSAGPDSVPSWATTISMGA